jgi:hypothetical protein
MINHALLIGLNYQGTSSALSGCINDVENTAAFLKSHMEFKDKDITIITDAREPVTRARVLLEFSRLVDDARKNTGKRQNIWFHYSGHGFQLRDTNGDEVDGKDECLYLGPGETVRDDDIMQYLLRPLPSKTRAICVVDACHSGTAVDLPFAFDVVGSQLRRLPVQNNHRIACKALFVSGCREDQTSADAWIPSKRDFAGALSHNLLTILSSKKYLRWRDLLVQLRAKMASQYSQKPLLSTNDEACLNWRFSQTFLGARALEIEDEDDVEDITLSSDEEDSDDASSSSSSSSDDDDEKKS